MPSVIRKSDGKVFDVFGAIQEDDWRGSCFLIFDERWELLPIDDFMPAPSLSNVVVTVESPKELHPGPPPGAAEEVLTPPDHDPDLEAQ